MSIDYFVNHPKFNIIIPITYFIGQLTNIMYTTHNKRTQEASDTNNKSTTTHVTTNILLLLQYKQPTHTYCTYLIIIMLLVNISCL